MHILVLGGTHPDEKEAVAVVESLIEHPIPNIKGLLVNLLAIEKGVRFIDKNMAIAYPGNPTSPYYEERRAAEVMQEIEALGPDVVIDLHNILGGKRHCVINPAMGVSPLVLGALRSFGVKHIAVNGFNVHTYFPNAFGLEIPSRRVNRRRIRLIRNFLANLATNPSIPRATVADFEWFRYSDVSGGGLHISTIHPNALTPEETKAYGSFKPLPPRIQKLLGTTVPLYAQSDLQLPNEQGYFTDLLEKIDAPDSSGWPL